MKRLKKNDVSSFGHEVTVRMPRHVAEVLFAHMRHDSSNEQMAFGLGHWTKTADGTMFVINELLLPDETDLCEQSACGVCPTPEFQAMVYFRALQTSASIVEFHTHPGGQVPHFSSIDDTYAHPNGEYIGKKFPDPVTLLMIVGNNRFDVFDGIAYDRHLRRFRSLDRLEVLGRPNEVHIIGESTSVDSVPSDTFDRQERIPGWNQVGLERQRIGIIGAGGNGAQLFQYLIAMGAGRQGFVAMADHDTVEPSNRPRIPYAFEEHVGTPKVSSAMHYAGRKSPQTPVFPFPCRFEEEAVRLRMKMATVLFYCGDTDGGRKDANEFAARYGIPLIDLGCDIQVSHDAVVAGGQVRLVLPGENACLVCCRGYDPAEAANDQMDDVARAQRAAAGYVVGSGAEAGPSVANLNGLTVQFAISQFLALVCGSQFAQWDYLHFDQFTGRTIPARTNRRDGCPVCGAGGILATGDPFKQKAAANPGLHRMEFQA